MQRMLALLFLLAVVGLTGCQTCDDSTDYSSPVAATNATEDYVSSTSWIPESQSNQDKTKR